MCIIFLSFFQKMPVPTAQHYNLYDYNFSDFVLDDDDTLKATIRMFLDLDLIEAFQIRYEVGTHNSYTCAVKLTEMQPCEMRTSCDIRTSN
jgi:hypothetical protein